jgi:hypothetical protein
MSSPRFKVTAQMLQKKINMNGLPGYFTVGNGPGMTAADDIDTELKRQDARTASSVPEKYRKLFDRIEGLIGIRYAAGGETSVTLPVAPTGDIQVFRNFPGRFGNGMRIFNYNPAILGPVRADDRPGMGATKPYSTRTADDAMHTVTVDGVDSKKLNLGVTLAKGDHIIVDFNHDAMGDCMELVTCVLELAGAEILRSMPTTGLGTAANDKATTWEKNAQMYLKRLNGQMGDYLTGIDFFDRLKLVPELETRMSGGTRPVAAGYGGLL